MVLTRNAKSHFTRISRIAGAWALAVGVVVLLGWTLDIPALKSVFPGLVTMKANAAVCFVCAGGALLLLQDSASLNQKRAGFGLTLVVAVIALLTMAEYAFRMNLGLDELLFRDVDTPPASFPGRMAPSSALCFALVSASLLILASGRRYRFERIPILCLAAISLLVLLGYLYDVGSLYGSFFYKTIALHAALTFFVLAIGLQCARPERDGIWLFGAPGATGLMARRLLPTALAVLIFGGWLSLLGERLGLYDPTLSLLIYVFTSVVIFTLVIWWNGRTIQRTEQALEQSNVELSKINRAYRTLSACNQALIRAADERGLLREICASIVEVGGYRLAWVGLGEGDTLRLAAQHGYKVSDLGKQDWKRLTAGPIGTALRTGKTQIMTDIGGDEARRYEYASHIAVAVRDNGHIYGVLSVYSADPTGFSEAEIELLAELAGDLGYGIRALRNREAQRQAEEQIRYQAMLLDNVSDAVISVNPNLLVKSWNKAAEQIYGWSADEVIGKPLRQSLRTDYLDVPLAEVMDTLNRTGRWTGEVIQHRSDGKPINVFNASVQLKDEMGNETGIVAVNRDMTEYRRTEAALRQSQQQFGVIFEEALDVILIIDGENGHILRANRATQSVLGYALSDLIGKHFSLLFPLDEHETSETWLDNLHTYGAIFEAQEFRRGDGGICYMDVAASLIPWETDKRVVLATLRDVTERRLMQEERLQAEMLRIEVSKERELVRIKEQFISTVSHEFRTPLTVILSSSEILERYHNRLNTENQMAYLRKIQKQVRFMTDMLDDILLISRARDGKLVSHPQPLDVVDFCRTLFEQAQLSANPQQRFSFNAPDDLREVMLDEKLLQHIVVNLLSNAVKYSPNGGEIRFDIETEREWIVLRVSDQGIGIPEKDQARLFETFQRASNIGTIQGTGLGLAIVRDSVTAHGGRIDVESQEGVGTTFTVRLPRLPVT
jgi:PAS domain S-box-containing protein